MRPTENSILMISGNKMFIYLGFFNLEIWAHRQNNTPGV